MKIRIAESLKDLMARDPERTVHPFRQSLNYRPNPCQLFVVAGTETLATDPARAAFGVSTWGMLRRTYPRKPHEDRVAANPANRHFVVGAPCHIEKNRHWANRSAAMTAIVWLLIIYIVFLTYKVVLYCLRSGNT